MAKAWTRKPCKTYSNPSSPPRESKARAWGCPRFTGLSSNMGGNVWVYSEPDIGSTFKVYLPATEKTRISDKAPVQKALSPKGVQHILVVEDNARVRNLACNILERLGYTISSAENGGQALDILEKQETPIDLLFNRRHHAGNERQGPFHPNFPSFPEHESVIHVRLHRERHRPPRHSGRRRDIHPKTFQRETAWPPKSGKSWRAGIKEPRRTP